MRYRLGTSGYSYPAWKGSFYPEKWPTKKMLAYYAERFSTVEINNTFYRMPTEKLVGDWAQQVGEQFVFVLKAPQRITHHKKLVDTREEVEHFWKVAQTLGEKLGPTLFQLPPFFHKNLAQLQGFLDELPKGLRCAFEFRHRSWFDEEVYGALRNAGAALCVAEDEKLTTPFIATANFGYLRLRSVNYTAVQLEKWSEDIKAQAFEECFVFFKHEDGGTGPVLAEQLRKLLG